MCRFIAEVVIDGAAGSFDKRYSYAIPEKLLNYARAGCRVTVPFGMGNSKKQGMILKVFKVKSLLKPKKFYLVLILHPY